MQRKLYINPPLYIRQMSNIGSVGFCFLHYPRGKMEPSSTEKFLGNPLAAALLSAGAAVTGPALIGAGLPPDPFAIALLGIVPGLAQSAIAERYVQRTRDALDAMRRDVEAMRIDLDRITEEQYKVASDCGAAVYATIDQAKLDYLRIAFRNSLIDEQACAGVPEALGRLVRDMSAAEIRLLDELFQYSAVCIIEDENFQTPEHTYSALIGSIEALNVSGLIRLGLLQTLAPSFDVTFYKWTALAPKLLALVRRR
ncbi:hypothetical protein [Pseudoduganella flava]|uniref:TerB family tellurite resistance protein n=2 Tax=Pseudoduganella flava TaxID=871742 RepID=A0ABX6FN83_9BURK|nr:hypothetical protein [Pseudoduganella flava]QGZ39020.1 hypothetical protein GO485_08125 [Pseudoduganella flava]